ncbi:MAG: BadF/BadG/BcrA/BcrD ATPase family protein [Thermofilaceae archaeon]
MYVLLVEGGKTKTLSVVVDEQGNIHGYHVGGSTGWSTVGFEKAYENLVASLQRAVRNSRISLEDLEGAILGLPDLDTERDKEYFARRLREDRLFRSRLVLVPDFVTAYYAVTLGDPGIAVIAGTGSIAFGRNSTGEEARAGGWGWFGGDEGSSVWIAMRALSVCYKSLDGRGERTLIAEKVLRFFSVEEPRLLIDAIYAIAARDVGELGKIAKLVSEAAEQGDPVARTILEEGGRELALMAKAVHRKIGQRERRMIIGGVGSVFSSRIVKESFLENLRDLSNAQLIDPLTGYAPMRGPAAIFAEMYHLQRSVIEKITRQVEELQVTGQA